YQFDGAHTLAPLDLDAHQSAFIVFRRATTTPAVRLAELAYRQVATLDGPWDVAFQPGRGAPARTRLPSLSSLSEHTDPAIKYFSGIATYTKTIDVPAHAESGGPLFIDLGAIGDVAEVRINGRYVGTAWKAPYRVEIAPDLRLANSTIEIRVANL